VYLSYPAVEVAAFIDEDSEMFSAPITTLLEQLFERHRRQEQRSDW
jgi:hypothetical protein